MKVHSYLLCLFLSLSNKVSHNTCFIAGVLLDDLLVAEDLAAAEMTSAASHAAAAAASSNAQSGRLPGRYGFVDDRSRQPVSETDSDGSVVLGSPVAPPVNGDMYTDISTENAMLPGSRYFYQLN